VTTSLQFVESCFRVISPFTCTSNILEAASDGITTKHWYCQEYHYLSDIVMVLNKKSFEQSSYCNLPNLGEMMIQIVAQTDSIMNYDSL